MANGTERSKPRQEKASPRVQTNVHQVSSFDPVLEAIWRRTFRTPIDRSRIVQVLITAVLDREDGKDVAARLINLHAELEDALKDENITFDGWRQRVLEALDV